MQRRRHAQACLHQPQPRFSLGLSVPEAPRPTITEKRDRQRPCPSSFRGGPLGLSSSGDSTRHQPVLLPALGTASLASLLPATTLRPLCAYPTTDPFAVLSTCIPFFFASARRPSNTHHHHLALGPAATPLRNHESRVVSTPSMAVALFMRCRCIY